MLNPRQDSTNFEPNPEGKCAVCILREVPKKKKESQKVVRLRRKMRSKYRNGFTVCTIQDAQNIIR
jgi:hypothetical protein